MGWPSILLQAKILRELSGSAKTLTREVPRMHMLGIYYIRQAFASHTLGVT